MSTSKLDGSTPFRALPGSDSRTALMLQDDQVAFRHNGLEFLSPTPIPLWTEVNVDLRSPQEPRPVRGSGVVVDCAGNRHTGYVVSLVFMSLTRQSQERLNQLAGRRSA